VGWEIDIDDETLEKYRAVKGDFGKRLWSQIEVPEGDDGEPAHFRLTECDRCPFLNDDNLCDIYINLGEDYLGYICTHHPRFYEWYVDGREAGLGLVCEAAAELILQKPEHPGYPDFEVIEEEDDTEAEVMEDEDLQAERETERMLFAMRDRLFGVIRPEAGSREDAGRDENLEKKAAAGQKFEFDRMIDELWRTAAEMQDEYDALIFSETDEAEADLPETPGMELSNGDTSDDYAAGDEVAWTDIFWSEKQIDNLLDFYLKLEINAPQWQELLTDMRSRVPELLAQREAFLRTYADHTYEYEQLLLYFLYRYFMKARYDDDLCGKVTFALISTCMIQLVDIDCWMQNGKLTHKDQIDICKMYAKEIEYDEGNVEEICGFQMN
jgi:lysine-N-methylase